MKTRGLLVLLIGLIALSPRAIQAQPLKAIPSECAVVVRFASIDTFLKNTNDMLSAIGGIAPLVGPQIEPNIIGDMFELKRKGDGLDRTAPAIAVAFPIPGRAPLLWFVKAKDEKALHGAIANTDEPKEAGKEGKFTKIEGGRDAYVAKAGGYIMYTISSEVVEIVNDSKEYLELPAAAVKEAEAGDASLIVNAGYLVKKYKAEMEQGKQEVLTGIDSLPNEALGPGGEQTKELYVKMVNLGFDTAFDARFLVGRINLNAKGAAASSMIGFKEGSKAGKLIAQLKTSSLEEIELLPAGQPIYLGARVDYGDIAMDLMKSFVEGQVKNKKAVGKAFDEMNAAGVGAMVTSFGFGDGTSGIQGTLLETAKDIKKLRAAYGNYMAAVGEINQGGIKQKVSYKKDVEKYKSHSIDISKMTVSVGDDAPAEVRMVLDGMYKKMFGGDGLESRITSIENMLLQVTSNDAGQIRKAIDRLGSGKNTVRLEDSYRETRGKLNEDAAMVMLLDLSQLIAGGFNMVKDVSPFDQLLAQVPFNFPMKKSTSYMGFSAGKSGGSVHMKGYIPVDQVKSIMAPFMSF